MHQAEFVSFLRTILIIVVVYYILKYVIRFLAPILLKKAVDKMQKKAQENYSTYADTKEGETVIDKKPQNINQKSNNDVGEYIDYEEID